MLVWWDIETSVFYAYNWLLFRQKVTRIFSSRRGSLATVGTCRTGQKTSPDGTVLPQVDVFDFCLHINLKDFVSFTGYVSH